MIKCKLIDCLNNEKVGRSNCCDDELAPTITKNVIPSSKDCPYYSNDFEKDLEEMRQSGGLLNMILRRNEK